ncbi:MAG: hypothetical protein R3C01_15925 [Planctomycetaceae bacterium]
MRRLLIEAAWHYYHARPNASLALLQRREGLPQEVIDIADNALRRLRKRSLKLQRIKKSATKIVTAAGPRVGGVPAGPPRSPRSVCIANRLPHQRPQNGRSMIVTNSNTRNANRHHSQQNCDDDVLTRIMLHRYDSIICQRLFFVG